MRLVQLSLDGARALVSSTNLQYGRVAEASCCDMGWISAEHGGTQHYLQSDEKFCISQGSVVTFFRCGG